MSRVEPNRNVYIGHRYVPLVYGEWDKTKEFEGLTIVTHKGASYTSKKRTPSGIDIENEEYWVLTGNYNAQIEYYRDDVERVQQEIRDTKTDLEEQMLNTRNHVDDSVEDLTGFVNDTVDSKEDKGTYYVNVKEYGAMGDGVNDDTQSIQNAFDDLFDRGGGELFFPIGEYITTNPIIVKTVAIEGGYSYAPIKIKGEGNNSSRITKINQSEDYEKDATIIAINGNTMDLDTSLSALHFENVAINNDSDASVTYAVYINRGSRIIVNYSNFMTKRDLDTVDDHDRYAFYIHSIWSSTFSDSTFAGDYGLYLASETTSIQLTNLYANCHKIGYHLVGVYSNMDNCFGDYAHGILFHFNFAAWNINSIGGESENCHTMIRATNSFLNIGSAFFNQSNHVDGTTIFMNGSTITIKDLRMSMSDDKGYLWKGGSSSNLTIEQLRMNGDFKFTENDFDNINVSKLNVNVYQPEEITTTGTSKLKEYRDGYWDWYILNPEIPINNIILGMKSPTVNSKGSDVEWQYTGKKGDVYINQDFEERKVLGWARESQTSRALRDGVNKYIPLILSGNSSERPEWTTPGMMYFDTTLLKPIWWTGARWVDGTGTEIE